MSKDITIKRYSGTGWENMYPKTKISNIADLSTQLANMLTKFNNYLPLNGGTMLGSLDMGNKQITNVAAPSADAHAVNRKYLSDNYYTKTNSNSRFATKAELTSGLAGKANTTHPHTTADITALTGLPTTATGSISTADTLNVALRKLQTQINSKTSNTGTVTQVKLGSTSYSPTSGVISLPAYPTVTTYAGSTSISLESGNTFQRAALTGDVTASKNSNATTIANNAVTTVKIADSNVTTAKIANNNVTTAKIADNAVTFTKMQNIATQTILGRGATGTGNIQALTLGDNLNLSSTGVLSAIDTKYTHPNSGVTAGTYRSVTVNGQGHVTAGTNPTTLTGYGITLTGDVSNSNNAITIGNNKVTTAKIANNAVTLSKIQNIGTNTVLGRTTSGTGNVEVLETINANDLGFAKTADLPTKVSDLTNDSGFTSNTGTVTQVKVGASSYNPSGGVISLPAYPTVPTYASSTSITLSGTQFQRAALTGDITASANSNATTISNNAVKTAKIANNAVTLSKIQNIGTNKVLGRTTANSGVVEELDLIDIGEITPSSWTQVWSGTINLNSYTSSFYGAAVPSNTYVGKRIAIEVQYSTGTGYTSKIIFGVLGTSSNTGASTSIPRGIGWSTFDGTNLRVKTLYAYVSSSSTASVIFVGSLKTLFGKFSGTTIDWSTSYSETLYMKKIWVIE